MIDHFSDPVWLTYFLPLLPLCSVLAAYFTFRSGLLIVFLVIGLMVLAARLKLSDAFADNFYLVLIFAVALSLVLSQTSISPYVMGEDANVEYALFQQVAQQGVWHPQVSMLYNAALTVTILPLIISTVTSLNGITIFKVVYPVLFSIVPLILYRIYRKIMSPAPAFLAVFLFLVFPATYSELTALYREMIAELIMVLLLWIQLSPAIRKLRGTAVLVMLLTLGLVMAHYSMAIIYVILMTCLYVVSRIRRSGIEGFDVSNPLIISLVTALGWFLLVASGIVLERLTLNVVRIVGGLSEFFVPSTRPQVVVGALGLSATRPGIIPLIGRATQYSVTACLVLGCVFYLLKRGKSRIENVITPLIGASLGLLLVSIVFPYAGSALNFGRTYQIALLLLSPCFFFGLVKIVNGLQWFLRVVSRHPIRIGAVKSVAIVLLFLYFLFTSGWVWAITRDVPTSPVLEQQRMAKYPNIAVQITYYVDLIFSEDVAAAQWARAYGISDICGDLISGNHVLTSYGGYTPGARLPFCVSNRGYVYVSMSNSLLGAGLTYGAQVFWFNTTATPKLLKENRIYSGGAVVYVNV